MIEIVVWYERCKEMAWFWLFLLAMVVVVGKLTDIIFIISLFRPPFPALAILCAHFGRWLAFQPPPHRRVCRRLLLHCNLRKNAFSKCTIVMAETEAALDFYGIKVDPILCSSWKEPLTSFSDKFEAILACLWPYLFHQWRRRPSVLPFIFPFISQFLKTSKVFTPTSLCINDSTQCDTLW